MPLATPSDGNIEIHVNAKTNEAEYTQDINRMRARIIDMRTSIAAAFKVLPKAIAAPFKIGINIIQSFGALLKNVLVGALLFFAISARKIFADIRDSVVEAFALKGGASEQKLKDLQGAFVELKASVGAAFLPLVEFAIPYIQMAVNWLTELFNKVAMITAAWMGQKTAMQVVIGSAAKLAKETEKSKKAAQGALAAFDQINVLAQKTPDADAPKVETAIVPITDEILTDVENFKEKLLELFNIAKGLFDTFMSGKETIDGLITTFLSGWETIRGLWKTFTSFWADTWESMKLGATVAWLIISNAAGIAWEAIKAKWSELIDWFTANIFVPLSAKFLETWYTLRTNAFEAWEKIKGIWILAVTWFRVSVLDPIRNAFGGALDWIGERFRMVFDGIRNFVYNTINRIVGFINEMINNLLVGINSALSLAGSISGAFRGPSTGGGGIGGFISGLLSNIRIPGLATGAVVPAHANMLAMIGEGSRSEIVAPDDKIRQIIREELGNAGGGGTIDNTIVLDGEVLYKATKRVERRHGASLISGGTV